MSALSIRAAAQELPRAIAITSEDGEHSTYAELARRIETLEIEAPVHFLSGEPRAARVIEALAAIERALPIAGIHPRWAQAERDRFVSEIRAARRVPAGTLAILATSGTSGRPRAAVLSRRALEAAARASAEALPLGPGDRWLLCMPIAHVGGLAVLVRSVIARSAITIAGDFEVARTLAVIARERPSIVSLVPTMLARLLEAGLAPWEGLRAILLGGAACPPRLLARAIERGLPIRTTYGLTEAGSQVATARQSVCSVEEGCGPPLPGIEIRIDRERGTIGVRGPSMFDGWLTDRGVIAPELDAEGYYDTGDLGSIDASGRLHVLSRRSDLVISGGENVYPAEVEAALEQVPGIEAACVFGLDDERWGQIVAAAIVGEADDATILSALGATIARFKIPRRIARLDALVINAAGKLDRRTTAERAAPLLRELAPTTR